MICKKNKKYNKKMKFFFSQKKLIKLYFSSCKNINSMSNFNIFIINLFNFYFDNFNFIFDYL